MPEPSPLTSEETGTLRSALATGKQPTVWFTSAAVGVETGRSGKVTALAEPAEGDFIQVRPTGSKDVLTFEAAEVTVTRPTRQRKPANPSPQPPAAKPSSSSSSVPATAPGTPAWSEPRSGARNIESDTEAAPQHRDTAAATKTRSTTTTSATTRSSAGRTVPRTAPTADQANTGKDANSGPANPASTSPKRVGTARKHRPVEMTVTLTSTLAGEWTVDVVSGKRRVAKALPLSPAVVAKVAKVLPPDVEDAIDSALDAAREQQRSRVEQLQSELADAKRTLDELFG